MTPDRLSPSNIAVRPQIATNPARIQPQEMINLTDAICLQDSHQLHLLVRTQTAMTLRRKAKPARRHAVGVRTGLSRHTGRVVRHANIITAAHEARKGRVGDGRLVPKTVGRRTSTEGVGGDEGWRWGEPVGNVVVLRESSLLMLRGLSLVIGDVLWKSRYRKGRRAVGRLSGGLLML